MSAHVSLHLIHCHACHLGSTWVYMRFGQGVPYLLRDIWQFKRCVCFSCSSHCSPHFLLLQLALSAILISSSTLTICHPKTLMKPLKPSWLCLLTWSHLWCLKLTWSSSLIFKSSLRIFLSQRIWDSSTTTAKLSMRWSMCIIGFLWTRPVLILYCSYRFGVLRTSASSKRSCPTSSTTPTFQCCSARLILSSWNSPSASTSSFQPFGQRYPLASRESSASSSLQRTRSKLSMLRRNASRALSPGVQLRFPWRLVPRVWGVSLRFVSSLPFSRFSFIV